MIAATVPFEAHLEVWTLMAGATAIGWYVWKVLQPKAVAAGFEPIKRSQVGWYAAAMVSMWIFSDWPIHEIAEQHLYFVHMLQHLFLSMIIPAMFLLATPRWLIELLVSPGSRGWRQLQRLSKPLVAGLIFNGLTVMLHWSLLVKLSFENGAVHFALHLLIFVSGLIMWMPVCGPVAEWRLPPIMQCLYLFCMSIIPTVPSGWLIFAEDVVYRHYDTPDRLFGIDVLSDQQAAGVVMKLLGGFFLWGVIFLVFVRWAHEEMATDERQRDEEAAQRARTIAAEALGTDGDPLDLTFEDVAESFAASEPPVEPAET